MPPTTFIQKAQEVQADQGNKSPLAIPHYENAINAWKEGDDEYDLLYAHYQLMWINSHYDHSRCLPHATACMELLRPTIEAGSIWHFTEMGQFHQEVIRYATNCIAWDGFLHATKQEELEKSIELVSMGCQYADDPAYFYIFDTKVRLLLKLERKEEAYTIVRSCLQRDKNFADFADIAADSNYQEWKLNLENGIVLMLAPNEKALLARAERIRQQIQDWGKNGGKNNNVSGTVVSSKIISIGEAREKYGIGSYHDSDDMILEIDGHVYVKGNLDTAWLNNQLEGKSWKGNLYGVLINGTLTVDGDVVDDEYLELFVKGNLVCDFVFSGNGIIVISGDAAVRYGIYGEYNDGSMDVYGKLSAPYLVSYDHSMPRAAVGDFIFIEGGNGTERESIDIRDGNAGEWSDGYYENAQRLLRNEVWDDADEFDVDEFFAIVRRGESPFVKM